MRVTKKQLRELLEDWHLQYVSDFKRASIGATTNETAKAQALTRLRCANDLRALLGDTLICEQLK